MAVQYSIQKMMSDGTLSTIALGIQYLQRNDIYMRIAGEETPQSGAPSGYTWSFIDSTTLKIIPVVPNGVEVVVYRRTDVDAMYNIYSQNAQFDEATIDENNQQLLYIAQEYLEQGIPGAGVDTIEFLRDDGANTYYRVKRTDGSYSDEFTVPSAGSITKILAREALRRTCAAAGYNLVDGSFQYGFVLTNANDVALDEATGVVFSGVAGTYPAGISTVSFIDKSMEINQRVVRPVSAIVAGDFPEGSLLEVSDRGGARFNVVPGVANGFDKIGTGNGLVAQLFDSANANMSAFFSGSDDATDALNAALNNTSGILVLQNDLSCDGAVHVNSSSKCAGIRLSGFKLTVKSGIFTVDTPHSFVIDLGGGEIDLGLKKAQLATDAPNGNVFNVVDASAFGVGDVVTCSFDLNKLPNDTARSTLPGNVLNTITDITGNQITMAYPFAANGGGGAPGYTSIPAGAWIINGIFTNPGLLYTGAGSLVVANGKIGKSSAGYAIYVNNPNATFISQNVEYDEAGLDMFNLRCKNIYFDGFYIGTSYDIAKQGIVASWSGVMSLRRGKFKRNNFDGDFYIVDNSQLGDMCLSEVFGDGGYAGWISTGFLSGDSPYVGIFAAQNLRLKSLKIDRCNFKNYQRNAFGSGDVDVVSSVIGSIEITNSDCNVPWLRTTFTNTNAVVSSDYVKIHGGAMVCSTAYRQNTGFTKVCYDNVELITAGLSRYENCQINNCRFNGGASGGAHIIDKPTVLLGRNSVVNGGRLLMQTGQLPASVVLDVVGFVAEDATGVYFPITSYVDSSVSSYYPDIEVVIPDFVPKVLFGSSNSSIRYRVELYRPNESSAPFDCKSRHAVYIVQGSLVHGVADATLYKSTAASTSVMSASYTTGTSNLVQNNSGTLPATGDIFAVLYANAIVGYHVITAASGNSFTINPPLRESITTTTLCALNKMAKVY